MAEKSETPETPASAPVVKSSKDVNIELNPPPTQPGEAVLERITKIEEIAPPKLDCPHCGHKLRAHNDAVGSMHCDGVKCRECCFLLDSQSETGVVEKMEARYCPERKRP